MQDTVALVPDLTGVVGQRCQDVDNTAILGLPQHTDSSTLRLNLDCLCVRNAKVNYYFVIKSHEDVNTPPPQKNDGHLL